MPGTPKALGPYTGGMINASDVTTIPDNALSECMNFDFDIDGFVIGRPAIVAEHYSPVMTPLADNRNHFTNPSGRRAMTGYVAIGTGTLGQDPGADTYFQATAAVASGTGGVQIQSSVIGAGQLNANTTYTCSILIIASAGTGPAITYLPKLVISGTGIAAPVQVNGLAGGFNLVSITFTTLATGTVTFAVQNTAAAMAIGNTVAFRDAMLAGGSQVITYFDGNTADAPVDPLGGFKNNYSWDGATDNSTSTWYTNNPASQQQIRPLGFYVRTDGETFLVAATNTATWIYDVDLETWTQIWSVAASGFCQYDDKIVMCSTTVPGGYWEAGSFTSTPTMPLMAQIVFYQERFWGFGAQGTTNQTTVWLSDINVISPPDSIYTWQPSINFFTVNQGDGQWITGLLADISSLIIFRNQSTFQFTFPSTPLQGTLRPLSTTIGADNSFAYARYQDFYMVQSQGFMYQFVNYRFYPLNTKKINFGGASLVHGELYDIRLSIFGPRVIVWFEGGIWVYNINLNTWSQWESPTISPGMFLQIPPTSLSGTARQALVVTGENDPTKFMLYRISEDPLSSASAGEAISAHIRTKAYSLDEPAQYKRMTYWTVQAQTASGLIGQATPVALPNTSTTYDAMQAFTFDDFENGTWDNPILSVPDYVDEIDYPLSSPTIIETKLRQGLRFLSIFFDVAMTFDGTTRTSPAKIYAITPYMLVKRSLTKEVN